MHSSVAQILRFTHEFFVQILLLHIKQSSQNTFFGDQILAQEIKRLIKKF